MSDTRLGMLERMFDDGTVHSGGVYIGGHICGVYWRLGARE